MLSVATRAITFWAAFLKIQLDSVMDILTYTESHSHVRGRLMRLPLALLSLIYYLPMAALADASPQSGIAFQSADIRSLQEDNFQNPGMLWVDKGAVLFNARAGTSNQACSDCHHNLDGAASIFPKINAHTGTLVNLTTQIQHCRVEHQGADPIEYESETALALAAYLGFRSRGESLNRPDESLQAQLDRGKDYYNLQKGQLDLACHQCHDQNVGKMLRGDRLSEGHGNGYPAYRLEWQTLGSLHRRLRACDIGVRAEPYPLGSGEYIELELYLKQRAAGLPIETPAVRR